MVSSPLGLRTEQEVLCFSWKSSNFTGVYKQTGQWESLQTVWVKMQITRKCFPPNDNDQGSLTKYLSSESWVVWSATPTVVLP